ncbi:dTDP-4-dehydrorhamnose reductase [bacterium]|nr:dTDP-4-dehydrorhamnose reductase [bacterium]
MKTVLITGGNGLLGQHLILAAQQDYRIICTDLAPEPFYSNDKAGYISSDLTESDSFAKIIDLHRPDAVINTAALTNVDKCETERVSANNINVKAAAHIALECNNMQIPFIHLSTDYVFSGEDGPYSEEDLPGPVSYYGVTKLESEKVVLDICSSAVIARTMVLYGYAEQVRPNFVIWLIEALGQGTPIKVVNDQWGHPTWAGDLAGMLFALLKAGVNGIYHTVGQEYVSRYTLALMVADVFDLDKSLIEEISSSDLDQTATRPLRSGLNTEKIIKATGYKCRELRSALMQMKLQMHE